MDRNQTYQLLKQRSEDPVVRHNAAVARLHVIEAEVRNGNAAVEHLEAARAEVLDCWRRLRANARSSRDDRRKRAMASVQRAETALAAAQARAANSHARVDRAELAMASAAAKLENARESITRGERAVAQKEQRLANARARLASVEAEAEAEKEARLDNWRRLTRSFRPNPPEWHAPLEGEDATRMPAGPDHDA